MTTMSHKMSISLPEVLYRFIEEYRVKHHRKNRSEVIGEALQLLQDTTLYIQYFRGTSP